MRLTLGDAGSRTFEAGVDRGVFFPKVGPGVAWNGLLSVKETTEGDGLLAIYVDGQKIQNQLELGQFSATIQAITYPDAMLTYDGYSGEVFTGQKRELFNLSFRSMIGNDIQNLSYGYRLHLVYNCLLKPTAVTHQSQNDTLDISTFSWDLTTVPMAVPYERPSAHFWIDSTGLEPAALAAVENILYGMPSIPPAMPTIAQLLAIFEANSVFTVTDNGDGTATITGPAGWVDIIGPNQAKITSPSITFTDSTHILARSY